MNTLVNKKIPDYTYSMCAEIKGGGRKCCTQGVYQGSPTHWPQPGTRSVGNQAVQVVAQRASARNSTCTNEVAHACCLCGTIPLPLLHHRQLVHRAGKVGDRWCRSRIHSHAATCAIWAKDPLNRMSKGGPEMHGGWFAAFRCKA